MTERRIKKGWMNLEVASIIEETWDTKTFLLIDQEDRGLSFDYEPGQYLTFRFDNIGERPLVRSYTMSSSPMEKEYSAVTVKKVDGGIVSGWFVDTVKKGDILRARGPIGKFCYFPEKDQPHLVMIGAGSGVTPFISIGRENAAKLGQSKAPKRMSWLFSFRTQKDMICAPLINSWPSTEMKITFSQEEVLGAFRGRISERMLDQWISWNPIEATYMICGPVPMMEALSAHLRKLGVPEEQIKIESFA